MDLRCEVAEAIHQGAKFLLSNQRANSFWCAELEANTSTLSDYVTLCRILNLDLGDQKQSIIHYYSERQNQNGSWSVAYGNEGTVISSTAEVYLVLKILGLSSCSSSLTKARNYIQSEGGLSRVQTLTRIKCAMFGLVSWEAISPIPAELVLLPSQLPTLLHTTSTWTRSILIPLLVIYHHRPVFSLPNETVRNAWLSSDSWIMCGSDNPLRLLPSLNVLRKPGVGFRTFFLVARDFLFRTYENHKVEFLRKHARKKCVDWILEHQGEEEKVRSSNALSSMLYTAVAMSLEGYFVDSIQVQERIRAIQACCWLWEGDNVEFRIQPCVLSVWDTALASLSLLECGWDPEDNRVERAMLWLLNSRLQFKDGDWKAHRPLEGWASEGCHQRCPDVDVTAAVLLSLLKQTSYAAASSTPIERAVRWCTRVQNSDGGWGASDVENGSLFHHNNSCSPLALQARLSTPDVTGHVLEALGIYLKSHVSKDHSQSLRHRAYLACQRGIKYLQLSQNAQGLWYGRWGVNCIYGTMNALCGLASAGVRSSKRVVFRAVNWLKKCQNGDGGWGEEGKSTPSQTAWALMGLMKYLPAEDGAVEKGIRWLIDSQTTAEFRYSDSLAVPISGTKIRCTWNEHHLYIYSHLCRHYFPQIALGRFLQLRSSSAIT